MSDFVPWLLPVNLLEKVELRTHGRFLERFPENLHIPLPEKEHYSRNENHRTLALGLWFLNFALGNSLRALGYWLLDMSSEVEKRTIG